MQHLGSLETEVMQRLWGAGRPMAVRDVLEELDRELAYTTAMTVLDNLHRKGLVTRMKRGRAYLYTPTKSREERTADLMGEVLAGAGDRGTALLRFVEQMSSDELAELRELLAENEAPPPGREDGSP